VVDYWPWIDAEGVQDAPPTALAPATRLSTRDGPCRADSRLVPLSPYAHLVGDEHHID
jgi:hypothetical protein